MKKYIFIDAETDGLYGKFIAVAIKVIDEEFNILDSMYTGISTEKLVITDEWVKKNVLPVMGKYKECDNEDDLLESVWNFWIKHCENSYVIAYVPYPVECRLFSRCVEKNIDERKFKGPYPLLDLASMLYAVGECPLLSDENEKAHNAMFDVDEEIRLFRNKIIKK